MSEHAEITDYIRRLISSGSSVIDRLAEDNSLRNDIQPSVEPETARFLEVMVRLASAKRVLELGTSNGYSSLWILKALEQTGGSLVTIDSKERLHLEAVRNFRAGGYSNVEAILGDAAEIIDDLEPGFDIIFQDCGKYLYPELFAGTVRLLKRGGLLIADDTLFGMNPGVRSNLGRFTDEYNRMVFGCGELLSSIIPVGHGLTVSFKI